MKFKFRASLILGFLFCSPTIAQENAQDLYRCDHPDGRIVYQASKCSIGVRQTAIDSQNAKREKFKQAQERERQRRKQKTKTKTVAVQPEQPSLVSSKTKTKTAAGQPEQPTVVSSHSVKPAQAGHPQQDGAHDKDGKSSVNTLRERSAKMLREGTGEEIP